MGTAVVIDDEVNVPGTDIANIVSTIRSSGGIVVELENVPIDPDGFDYERYHGVSVVIMDWTPKGDLSQDEGGEIISIPAGKALEQAEDIRKLDFLAKLMKSRMAPIFIFTAEEPSDVESKLRAHKGFKEFVQQKKGTPTAHILVKR